MLETSLSDVILTVGGALIVLIAVADVFFTVLFPASRHGPVRKPLTRLIWGFFRLSGKMLSGQRKRNFQSYSGPVVIALTMTSWFLLLATGFAMIFKPALGDGILDTLDWTGNGWNTAFYFSGFSLTTLGIGDVSADTPTYRLLSVLEAALGFSFFSMSISYFLSVYSNLGQRNAFAQGLHHLTGKTGNAACLLARLSDDGDLSPARQHFSDKAQFLREIGQAHRLYPVLRLFHYRDNEYALPRILLTALDTAALVRSALDEERYSRLVGSASLDDMEESAMALMNLLLEGRQPHSQPDLADSWRDRYAQALDRLRRAGVEVRRDEAAGADQYVAMRSRWDGSLRRLADYLLYDWEEVDSSRERRSSDWLGAGPGEQAIAAD